jgi:hypothetical protein
VSFLSPMTLYLRAQRGIPAGQFAQLAGETAIHMATDPNFRKFVADTAKYQTLQNINDAPSYDYYGDRSNVLNRFSFIGLLDAVYSATKSHRPFGLEPLEKSVAANAPGFLGFTKPTYDLGDWMAWQSGMLSPGLISYLNFGLPMEGLASWGWVGFVAYPFIFMLPVLLIFGRMSSLRLATPVSVYLFTDLHAAMIEATSDGFIATVTRNAPVTFLVLFALYQILFRRSSSPAPVSIAAATQR